LKVHSFFIGQDPGPGFVQPTLSDPIQIEPERGTMLDATAVLSGADDIGVPYPFTNLS
jgi:hypothetical protein